MVEGPVPALVALVGEFDLARAEELQESILSARTDQSQVIVDLSAVTFIDSSALRAFIDVRRQLQRHGVTIVVQHASPAVSRVFTITGMADMFGLAES